MYIGPKTEFHVFLVYFVNQPKLRCSGCKLQFQAEYCWRSGADVVIVKTAQEDVITMEQMSNAATKLLKNQF